MTKLSLAEIRKLIRTAKNVEDIWLAYTTTSGDSTEESLALKKWATLSTKAVQNAQCITEARKAWEQIPPDMPELVQLAINKWLSLATTSTEVYKIYRVAECCSREETAAEQKWLELTKEEASHTKLTLVPRTFRTVLKKPHTPVNLTLSVAV